MGYSRPMVHHGHDPSADRVAQNNRRFREANQEIESAARRFDADFRVPFICECAAEGCTELIRLSLGEYTHVRAHPLRFVVVPGHEGAEGSMAEPVERLEDYVIVEKTGESAEILRRLDRESADKV